MYIFVKNFLNDLTITSKTSAVMTGLAAFGIYTLDWTKIEKIVKNNPEKSEIEICKMIKEESEKHAQQ